MQVARVLALVLAVLVTAARPSAALTKTEWVKRVYSDILQRPPTSQELSSAVVYLETSLQDAMSARMSVALTLVSSDEWVDNFDGADPFKPGLSQLLLSANLAPSSAGYYRCQFKTFAWTDEQIIADVISSTAVAACGGFPLIPSGDAYATRAVTLNPNFAACSQACSGGSTIKAIIDQIYQDLLGRHASIAELNLVGSDQEQIQETLSAMGVGGGDSSTPLGQEYLERLVRSAFLRFLHRLPSEIPNTAPVIGFSELQYFVGLVRSVSTRNEWFYAVLVSLPEYDTAVPQTPPAVDSLLRIAPAGVIVSAPLIDRLGSPPPLIGQVISPLFLNGLVTTSSAAVVSLSTQVLVQDQTLAAQQINLSTQQGTITALQQTITALAVDTFGGPATRASAEALIAAARAKLAEAQALICPIETTCADKTIVRARAALALAQEALDSNEFDEAERHARGAYQSAERAEARR